MYATDTLRLQILKVIEQMRFPPPETKLYFLNQKIYDKIEHVPNHQLENDAAIHKLHSGKHTNRY